MNERMTNTKKRKTLISETSDETTDESPQSIPPKAPKLEERTLVTIEKSIEIEETHPIPLIVSDSLASAENNATDSSMLKRDTQAKKSTDHVQTLTAQTIETEYYSECHEETIVSPPNAEDTKEQRISLKDPVKNSISNVSPSQKAVSHTQVAKKNDRDDNRDSTGHMNSFLLQSNGIPCPPSEIPKGFKSDSDSDIILEEKDLLEPIYVGRVIGKSGEMIRDLMARSACQIDVDQNVLPNKPRIILYRGTRKSIDIAKNLIHILCSDVDKGSEFDLPLGVATQKILTVPNSCIGKLIGRKGDMIRELQIKSQAKIQVDHSNISGDPKKRLITLIGTNASVAKAEEMIFFIIDNPTVDSMTALNTFVEGKIMCNSGYPGTPSVAFSNGVMSSQEYHPGVPFNTAYHPAHSFPTPVFGYDFEIFHCPKQYMGRVIGKQGQTINDIQKRTGCDIQINQKVPQGHACEITIKGTRAGIDSVKRMFTEIIRLGPNHPYVGGTGGQIQGLNLQSSIMPSAVDDRIYVQQPYNSQTQLGFIGYAPVQYLPQSNYMVGNPMNVNHGATWKSAFAPDGQIYYYNDRGETTWEKPPGFV